MLVKATAIVKFSGIYKWDIINPLKDCLKNGKPIKNEQLGYGGMNVMFLIYSFTMQQKPL